MKLSLIGWWVPRACPLSLDEDERFISLVTVQEEGGIREPYRSEVVPVYIDLEDDSGLVPVESTEQTGSTWPDGGTVGPDSWDEGL